MVLKHLANEKGLFFKTVDLLRLINPHSLSLSLKNFEQTLMKEVQGQDGSSLACLVSIKGFHMFEQLVEDQQKKEEKQMSFMTEFTSILSALNDQSLLVFVSKADLLSNLGFKSFSVPSLSKTDRE